MHFLKNHKEPIASFITAECVTRYKEASYGFDKSDIEKTILVKIMGYHLLRGRNVKQEKEWT